MSVEGAATDGAAAEGPSDRPSARADLVSALVWILFGAALMWGGWTMDRLENQHINPWTAPGLVPGLLGCGIVVMGSLLLLRSVRQGGLAAGARFRFGGSGQWSRVALAILLCVAYAAGLLGRDLPFWATSALFVFLFAFLFDQGRAAGGLARSARMAALVALGAGIAITLVFQEIFLVRLP